MRFNTVIYCRGLSDYTIYFLLSGGRDGTLNDGRKVFLSNPSDEDFTVRAINEKLRFDDIESIYYNLPVLDESGGIYDANVWWELLSTSEKQNLQGIYASGFVSSNSYSDTEIKYIYRQLLLTQFERGVIKLPEYENALNWWMIIPSKNKEKILYQYLVSKNQINYSLDDVKYLSSISIPELDDRTLSVLNWWRMLSYNEKLKLIHQNINPHFHVSAPDIDQIKSFYEKK